MSIDATNIIEVINKDINYEDAISYWTDIPPTVDGMLGGFGFISSIDIRGSEQFLKSLFQLKNSPGKDTALDCGAGIGRITKHLLLNFFNKVDLVEPVKNFIDEARKYAQDNQKIGDLYNVGLQDFKPCIKYDVIWCQWVLSHLTNPDLVSFFRTCRKMDIKKENLSLNDEEFKERLTLARENASKRRREIETLKQEKRREKQADYQRKRYAEFKKKRAEDKNGILYNSIPLPSPRTQIQGQSKPDLRGNDAHVEDQAKANQSLEPNHKKTVDLLGLNKKQYRETLRPNGMIVVKENLSTSPEGDVDEADSSRTRHETEMKQLFSAGGLRVVKESVQKRFPKGLYQVKMYALRPDS